MTPWQETAALRDFKPAYDRYGSFATDEVEGARPRMSAVPRGHRFSSFPPPTLGERRHRGLAGLSVPARGSSAADLTTRYIPSRTPSLETDSVGKSHRAPTPGPDTVVAWHSCSCR